MVRWAVLLVCLLPFSGCLGDDTLELTLADVPETVRAGAPFTFTMTGTGSETSTHVGAHYWTTSTDDPTADFGDAGGCAHLPGETGFPDSFTVTCTVADPGTIYLRGHVRTADEANYWSTEFTIKVLDYDMSTEGTFAEATVDEAASFELIIAGNEASTDHLGAHYFDTDVADPTASFADQAGACDHQPGTSEVPGRFTVSCTFTEAGTYYVFGHLRVDGHNFWASSFHVEVS